MTFICPNKRYVHTHELVNEARVCMGLIRPTAPVAPAEPKASGAQIIYIRDLGGDMEAARAMTKKQASAYIDQLRRGGPVSTPAAPAPRAAEVYDKRLDMIRQFLDTVPNGYFAVQEDEGGHTDFLRISRPKPGSRHYSNSVKVQTQHGDRLEVAAAFWLSGHKPSIYKRSVIPMLLLLVVDWRGAALRYAKEIGRCCRCNAQLTDDRSRHYGIGPECEGHWPEIISLVDEQNNDVPFERLPRG